MKLAKLKNTFKDNIYIISILIVAFLLRIIGISYGYPYIFNIDEPALIRSSQGLFFNKFINHFDWPHFNFYFNFIIYWLFIKVRAVIQIIHLRPVLESVSPKFWNDPFSFYLVSRVVNVLFGTFTILGIYKLAKIMFDKKVAIMSALILAIIPYHVYISHIAIQEPALLFWAIWSVYFAYKFSLKSKYLDLIISAVFLAFASGVKYNAALIGAYGMFFIILNYYKLNNTKSIKRFFSKKNVLYLLKAFFIYWIISLFAFLISNYQIIKHFDLFWSYEHGRGFLWQLKINSKPISDIKELIYTFANQFGVLIKNLGYTPMFVILIGLFLSLIKKKPLGKDASLVYGITILTFLNLLFTMRYERSGPHYYVIYYGFIAILTGYFIIKLLSKTWTIYLVILPLIIFSIYYDYLFLRTNSIRESLKCYEIARETDKKVWFNGSTLSDVKSINNLNMSRFKDLDKVERNQIIISEEKLDDDSLHLIKMIDNKHKFGPKIYIYVKD